MLTKEAKQILDYSIPIFKSGKSNLEISQIINEIDLPRLDITSTIDYLVDEGYFKIKKI